MSKETGNLPSDQIIAFLDSIKKALETRGTPLNYLSEVRVEAPPGTRLAEPGYAFIHVSRELGLEGPTVINMCFITNQGVEILALSNHLGDHFSGTFTHLHRPSNVGRLTDLLYTKLPPQDLLDTISRWECEEKNAFHFQTALNNPTTGIIMSRTAPYKEDHPTSPGLNQAVSAEIVSLISYVESTL